MTEKQIWARKRNWLIRRLMGAKSIFSYENVKFMEDAIRRRESSDCIFFCEDSINDLISALRRTSNAI